MIYIRISRFFVKLRTFYKQLKFSKNTLFPYKKIQGKEFLFSNSKRPYVLKRCNDSKKWGADGQNLINPNMVNEASTVLMPFFTGGSQVDKKSERHGTTPNKVLVGGAKADGFWLVQDLKFSLYWCPIMKFPFWTLLSC